jgi:phytoene dehydrogenase-like protein
MHIAWAYCHVPHGSPVDATQAIETHIETFAPGFRDLIVSRSTMNAIETERYNANYVGGDINGGLSDAWQLFTRPMIRIDPYATPAPDIFLCSASTPPGGGVHGMCGYYAARSALHRVFGKPAPALAMRASTSPAHAAHIAESPPTGHQTANQRLH